MSNWEPYLKHPVVVLLAAGAVSVTATYGVMSHFHSEKMKIAHEKAKLEIQKIEHRHTTELQSLNTQVRGIERRLGGKKYIDVSTMFKNRNIDEDNSSLKVKFFEAGNFYATTDNTKWQVKKIHEAELHQELVGVKKEELFPPGALNAMSQFHTWLWRGKLEHKVSGSDVMRKIFPYLMVQSIPNGAMGNVHVEDSAGNGTPFEFGDDFFDPADLQARQVKVSSDTAAVYLTRKLHGIMKIASTRRNLKYRIRNIQKRGPVMYLQAIYKLENVAVDDKPGVDLYVVNEWFMISREKDLLVIEAVAPSKDPSLSEDHFVHHNLWIASFQIGRTKF